MQLNLFRKRVVCQHCQCETENPLEVRKHLEHAKVITFMFCGELCASLYYTELLRKQGSDLVTALQRAGM